MTEIKMGDSRMEGAYEISEILISNPSIVEKWLDDAEELPHTLMHTIAGWYTHAPRPSAEDIVSCHLGLRGPWHVLTLKIRRGKDVVAEFLSRHEDPSIWHHESGEGLVLLCTCCEGKVDIPWDSIGHTGGSLVKQAVSPCNAKKAVSAGSIQRTVDSGSSNRES